MYMYIYIYIYIYYIYLYYIYLYIYIYIYNNYTGNAKANAMYQRSEKNKYLEHKVKFE